MDPPPRPHLFHRLVETLKKNENSSSIVKRFLQMRVKNGLDCLLHGEIITNFENVKKRTPNFDEMFGFFRKLDFGIENWMSFGEIV